MFDLDASGRIFCAEINITTYGDQRYIRPITSASKILHVFKVDLCGPKGQEKWAPFGNLPCANWAYLSPNV
jgi:hypothetical protein